MIISLSGYAGSGKNAVADILIEQHGFKAYAWADTLRAAAAALNPIVAYPSPSLRSDVVPEPVRYNDAIEALGYDTAKFTYPEVRQILQRLGTEVGRYILGENIWVDTTLTRINKSGDSNVVITDTRFPNEVDAVKNYPFDEGFTARVNRPGVNALNDHPSETSLNDYSFDYELNNNGTLEDLGLKVQEMLNFFEKSC